MTNEPIQIRVFAPSRELTFENDWIPLKTIAER